MRRECIEKAGLFSEAVKFSDYRYICNLAYFFDAFVFYDLLFFRRVHASNSADANWDSDYRDAINMVIGYRREKRVTVSVANDNLFFSYIHWGETYLAHKMPVKALNCFARSFRYNTRSAVPLKKCIKAVLYLMINRLPNK